MAKKAASSKRTSKRTLNAQNLKSLGAPRLAELLMAVTAKDTGAKRLLRLELAILAGPEAVAKLARTRLGALAKAETRVSWKQVPALSADLEAHHRAIMRSAGKEKPSLAIELLWLLIAAAASLRDRSGFVTGYGEVHKEAIRQLGELASVARPDPEALAEDAFRALVQGRGYNEPIIPELAPALGAAGLAHLKRRLRERDDHSRSGREPLLAIADAEGDVDEFIRLHPAEERKRPHYAADIARRLLAVGRAGEARRTVDAAEGGQDARDIMDRPDFGWADARIEALEALGRHGEAQEQRWSCFDRELSIRHLRAWVHRFPSFDGMDAEERAFDHAERFHDETAVLDLFVQWPDLARASSFVLRHAEALNGHNDHTLTFAAEELAARFPLAATLVLRCMIDHALSKHRKDRFRDAARQLAECAGLAGAIADFGRHPDHEAYVKALRQRHPYEYAFWSKVR